MIMMVVMWECLKLFAGALRRQTSKRGSVATCLRKTKAWNPSGTLPLSNRWWIYFETQRHSETIHIIYSNEEQNMLWKRCPFQLKGSYKTKIDRIQWRLWRSSKKYCRRDALSTGRHLWDEVWQNPIMESNGATVVRNAFLRTFHSNYVCPKAIYISS